MQPNIILGGLNSNPKTNLINTSYQTGSTLTFQLDDRNKFEWVEKQRKDPGVTIIPKPFEIHKLFWPLTKQEHLSRRA